MERTEQITAQPSLSTVTTFDSYGSTWGTSPLAEVEADIAAARATGAPIDEWNVTDRDGLPMTIVRFPDPTFLDTITVITGPTPAAVTA